MLNVEAGGIGIRSLSDGDAPAKFLDASDECAVDRVADLAMVCLPFENYLLWQSAPDNQHLKRNPIY
jgi:hypothetical protein